MDMDAFQAIQRIDFYQAKEDSADPFTQLIQLIANREESGQGEEDFRDNYQSLFEHVSDEDLVKDNGIILMAAVDKGMRHTVEYLMKQTDEWPRDVVQECIRHAAENGYDYTTLGLLDNTEHVDGALYQEIYDNAPDDTMRSNLKSYRKKRLGEGWNINDDYEIQRTTTNDIRVTNIFNFASCHVTTVIHNNNASHTVVTRDFKDLQQDDELKIAYNKLSQFVKTPPPYRGKDATSQRRVPKRTKGQTQ